MWICWPAPPMPWLAWQSRHGAMLCRRSLWTWVRELCWWLAWTTLTCALVSKFTFNSPQGFQMSQVQKKTCSSIFAHPNPRLPLMFSPWRRLCYLVGSQTRLAATRAPRTSSAVISCSMRTLRSLGNNPHNPLSTFHGMNLVNHYHSYPENYLI